MAIVTISRKSGTGAKDIAKAVAKGLRYEFVSMDSVGETISLKASLTPCGSVSPRPWRIGRESSASGSESTKRRPGKS